MSVTSEDVAKAAGVSRATVSFILNGRGQRFAEATREKVTRIAKEMNYEPSAAGRALARGSSDIVIAIIPNTTFGGNLQEIYETATDMLEAQGMTLILRLATKSNNSLDRLLAGQKPRAVISLTPFSEAEREILTSHNVAYIEAAEQEDLIVAIGRLQAKHLLESGFTKIAVVHLEDERGYPFGAGREIGAREVCRETNAPVPEVFTIPLDLKRADAVLEQIGVGYGLACYNDDVAITLLNAAKEKGWRIPKDVGIIGMDNMPLAHVMSPKLTTIGYDNTIVANNTALATLAAIGAEAPAPFEDIDLFIVPGETT